MTFKIDPVWFNNGGVDLFGRCLSCGKRVETSAGCTPCWQRRMSEAASTTITMEEPAWMPFTHTEVSGPPKPGDFFTHTQVSGLKL